MCLKCIFLIMLWGFNMMVARFNRGILSFNHQLTTVTCYLLGKTHLWTLSRVSGQWQRTWKLTEILQTVEMNPNGNLMMVERHTGQMVWFLVLIYIFILLFCAFDARISDSCQNELQTVSDLTNDDPYKTNVYVYVRVFVCVFVCVALWCCMLG